MEPNQQPAPGAEGSDSLVGVRIGPYLITRELGRGGMSVVYEAHHESIGQVAAVKVLPTRRASQSRYQRRLYDEARAISMIGHEGLVKIFDFGALPDGPAYILMEYLRGETLRQRLSQAAALEVEEALRLAGQMAAALAAAHRHGVVHRDLKPDNVMLIEDPVVPGRRRAKLLDFGIAKMPDGHTTPGTILGTVSYMAPEQCLGAEHVDERADVYALGVMLYEMLSGRLPFTGTRLAVLEMHLYQTPPSLQQLVPAVPNAVLMLVQEMLAKDPAARPTMSTVAAYLLGLEPSNLAADSGSAVFRRETEPGADRSAQQTLTGTNEAEPAFAGPALPEQGQTSEGSPPVALAAKKDEPGLDPQGQSWWRRGAPWMCGIAVALAFAGGVWWKDRFRTAGRAEHPAALPPGMVLLQGGTFFMGSSAKDAEEAYRQCVQQGDSECRREVYEDGQPRRRVTVSPFYLYQTEVTNQQFAEWLNGCLRDGSAQVMEDPPGEKQVRSGGMLLVNLFHRKDPGGLLAQDGLVAVQPGKDQYPVTWVSWYAALRYCQAHGGRLPSEAEWEYAARGLSAARFPWGDAPPRCDGVVFGRRQGMPCAGLRNGTEAVGTAAQDASPQGVHDLGGNVSEWVMDRFTARYQPCTDSGCVDPITPAPPATEEPTLRVVRGGAWHRPEEAVRGAGRSRRQADSAAGDIGFRCVLPVHT